MKLANPAPLGLMGFGMTTVLLNIHNASPDKFPLGSMILAMGIFYGGMAQIFAGIMEYKNGNTFGTTAFTSYGLFWLSLVALIVMPEMMAGIAGPAAASMGWYFLMWGFFTMMMFVGTLKANTGLQVIFFTLFVLFYLLAMKEWGWISGGWIGLEGILCGLSAVYVAMAEVINESFGKTILPLGGPLVK